MKHQKLKGSKEILFTYALDANNELIFANDAEKGKKYYCPLCHKEFVLRKGTKRRHHFAHKVEMFNCNPETLLHKMFKEQAAKYLQNLIDDNDLCLMYWRCSQCKKVYSGNLLYMAKSLAVEFDLGVCRPDILLFDSDKRPIIAIEIVVTHKPEPQVEEYYKKNGIVLCQINLSSNDDLDYIEEKLLFPDIVNFCLVSDCGFLENNHHYESYVIDVFKEMLPSGNLHNIIKYDHLTPFGRYKTEQHETKPKPENLIIP